MTSEIADFISASLMSTGLRPADGGLLVVTAVSVGALDRKRAATMLADSIVAARGDTWICLYELAGVLELPYEKADDDGYSRFTKGNPHRFSAEEQRWLTTTMSTRESKDWLSAARILCESDPSDPAQLRFGERLIANRMKTVPRERDLWNVVLTRLKSLRSSVRS